MLTWMNHQELCSGNGKIEIKVSGYDRKQLGEMIRSMIQEQNFIGQSQRDTVTTIDGNDGITLTAGDFDEDIVRILDNLEVFNEL